MSKHYFSKLIDREIARLESTPPPAAVNVTGLSSEKLAAFIDHTKLKPDTTRDDVITLCEEAKQFGFASVCVNPSWVPLCVEQLEGSPVLTCAVVGFPLGAGTSETKTIETEELVTLGVDEVDMVLNIGRLKDEDFTYVYEDIQQVVDASEEALVKVILETCLLTEKEIIAACVLSKEAGANFVDTSTGFSKAGATTQHVFLMRHVVGAEMGVKAAGGVRNRDAALAMIQAGASRIGAGAGGAVVK